MSLGILGIACLALACALVFVLLKIRSLRRNLLDYQYKLSVSESGEHLFKTNVDEKLNLGLRTITDKSDQIISDPLVNELTDTFKSRLTFFSKLFVKVLESSHIILGISTGLFGMSVVAVVFHFMKYVGNHRTAEVLESVSYSVFFLSVTLGIISNNYLQRKIKREKQKLSRAEAAFEEKLQNLKVEYEAILDKSQKEQHDAILAKTKIVEELSQLATQRQNEISSLESRSTSGGLFLKIKERFSKKIKAGG
jgi:predicted PurR-regulated permease PerM